MVIKRIDKYEISEKVTPGGIVLYSINNALWFDKKSIDKLLKQSEEKFIKRIEKKFAKLERCIEEEF